MQFGYQVHGGRYVPIIGPRHKTLIIRSPETLDRLFLEDIHAGRDAAYFGDADRVLPYIPRERIKDTKLFHRSEERPLRMDIFQGKPEEIADNLLEALAAAYPSSIPTNQINRLILAGTVAVSEVPDATLLYLYYFLMNPHIRDRALSHMKDRAMRDEWEQFNSILKPKDQYELLTSSANRLQPLIADKVLRRMIAQKKPFDTSGVLIVDLPENDRHNLIAALVLSQTTSTAYIQRPILHVGKSIPIISASHLGEIPEHMLHNFLNTATILSARTGAVDAKVLEPHFNLNPSDHLTTIAPEKAFIRLDKTYEIFLEAHQYPHRKGNERKIKANTIQRYGTPKAVIDAKIDAFLDSSK